MRSRWISMRRAAFSVALALSFVCAAAPVGMADNCTIDVWYNGDAPARMLFPNWSMAYQGTFTVLLALNGEAPEYLTGVTVVNFGDAMQGTEIEDVYIKLWAGAKDADSLPIDTMTYVGMWTFDDGMGGTTQYPAWTWGGYPTVQLAYGDDYCSYNPACGKYFTLSLYTDIAPCPAEGKTVNLGFPSAAYLTPDWPGSIHDIAWTASAPGVPAGCVVPWWATDTNRGADEDTIVWGYKTGPDQIGPGDTVNYTIYFGLPGTGSLTYIDVTDTLPPYMHYVMYSGSPAPAPGWDPDPGPPVRLKWSYGSTPTTGGPTNMITYAATVDWGNTESFEPGSGDIAAPEAFRLINSAQIAFGGSDCVKKGMVTEPTSTVVKRFLFWKLGDNDMLFASSMGKPNDEMIYSIFMKNVSTAKTWWNVTIWDTVPAEVDVWCADCGMEDPCVGWTMTPTGCAAAAAGKIITGAKNTILTWHLDMEPQYTLTVRWKAQLKSTIIPNSTVINRASIQGMGRVAVVDGTGNTGVPRNFTHLALVKLRTTYTSYVAYAGDSDDKGACPGMIIDFFPLNKATQFELRGIQYAGGPWAEFGGVSQSIGCIIGDCVSGFPGNLACTLGYGTMALSAGVTVGAGPAMGAGCKAERIPAYYIPTAWVENCPPFPFNFIYKITSNSPVTWQMLTLINNCNQDRHTYAPSSNLSYIGYMLYTWRSNMPDLSSLSMINTSDTSITTVHMFRYDYTISDWAYQRTYELAIASQATNMGCTACGDYAPWRIISSDAPLIVNVGESSVNTAGCCCGQGSDNHMALAPTRETGFTTGNAGQTFYAIANPMGVATSAHGCVQIGWGKTSAAPATIDIYGYTPLSSFGNVRVPSLLRDTAGTWGYKGTYTLDAPSLPVTANNPILFLATPFNRGSSNLFKAVVTSGGPIIINSGTYMFSHWSGGTVIHSWDTTNNVSSPSGAEFWLTQTTGNEEDLFTNFFTPETGVRIGMYSNDGASAEYTTNGTDQCVAFRALTDLPDDGMARNTVIVSKTAGTAMIAMFQANRVTEKGFTAPFLSTGTYYDIIAPPTAFIGEEFWITIVVRSELGGIVTNYTGTTSFSSTDPAAKVEASAMDTYNYTWTGASGDAGDKIFYRVSFTKLGMQTLVASDTMDGSIVGLASIMIVGVDVRFFKEPRLSTAASGDTVNFKICWSNYSSASALSFVITDAVPKGTTYVAQVASNHICGTTSAIAYDFAYSTSQSSSPPAGGSFSTTTGTPAGNVYWLRWTIKSVGIETTGCACFKVQIQ